jgi:hypothetical protein
MMQHHNNLDQNSLKLSKITEERLNHHSIDGVNSARGKGAYDDQGDGQNGNLALDIAALKSSNFQLNFENLIHIEEKL